MTYDLKQAFLLHCVLIASFKFSLMFKFFSREYGHGLSQVVPNLCSPESENISPGQHVYGHGRSSLFGIMPYPFFSPMVPRNLSATDFQHQESHGPAHHGRALGTSADRFCVSVIGDEKKQRLLKKNQAYQIVPKDHSGPEDNMKEYLESGNQLEKMVLRGPDDTIIAALQKIHEIGRAHV